MGKKIVVGALLLLLTGFSQKSLADHVISFPFGLDTGIGVSSMFNEELKDGSSLNCWLYVGLPKSGFVFGPNLSLFLQDRFRGSVTFDLKLRYMIPPNYSGVYLAGSTGYGGLDYGDVNGFGHLYEVKAGAVLSREHTKSWPCFIEVSRGIYRIDGTQTLYRITAGVTLYL